jgi:phosphatidylglycerol:prolipoprotein diacylglycerol transferase
MFVLPYPRVPPVIISVGPFAIRWYGVMYLVGYLVGYRLALGRICRGATALTREGLDSLVWYLVIGMLIGARLTYVVVYGAGCESASSNEIRQKATSGASVNQSVMLLGDVASRAPLFGALFFR